MIAEAFSSSADAVKINDRSLEIHMPKQETFFEQESGKTKIEVLKSYDSNYAREAFRNMDGEALKQLWAVLELEKSYDPADLPPLGQPDGSGEDFLWDELADSAREYGSELSFFVVNETHGTRSESLWVSPDWPSAEAFAKARLDALRQRDANKAD